MPFSNPMRWGVLVLMLLPIIGTILWLLKRVLKLSFSVGKILLLLFAIWFVFTAVTGGLSDVFGNISKPKISQEDGKLTYISAFSKTNLDLADYQEQNQEYSVNTAFGSVTVTVPQGTVVKLTVQGFASTIHDGEDKTTLAFGEKELVVGSGSNIVEMRVNAAFMRLNFIRGE